MLDESQYVKRTELSTTTPIDQVSSGWYSETCIENHSGESIYVMRPSGEIQEVAPLFRSQNFGRRVIVKHAYRCGLVNPDPGMITGKPTYASPKYPRIDTEINFSRLIAGPLFLMEFGIALATEANLSRLKEENYLDPDFYHRKILDLSHTYFECGYPTPLVINANCHDPSIDFLYVEINGTMMSLKVRHDLESPEYLDVSVNLGESHDIVHVDFDWSKSEVKDVQIKNQIWIMGTSRDKVFRRIKEKADKNKTLLTQEEVNRLLEEKTQELQRKLDEAIREKEQTARKLELMKTDLSNANAELARANDMSKATFEQQQLAYKLATQSEERALNREKQDLLRDQTRWAQEQAQAKAEADLAIARAKVHKEQLSLQGAEATNISTLAKSATILLPIVASAAIWIGRAQSTSSLAVMVGSASAAVMPAVAIGAILSWAVKPVVSVVKHAVNVISSKAKRLCNWFVT